MKIKSVVCAPARTGFFFDDQLAIKSGAVSDGSAYIGEPKTPGFTKVRQAGEAISVLLILDDGRVAHGDCAAVQYSGAGGRDPLFLAKEFIPFIMEKVAPTLIGKEITTFRAMAQEIEDLRPDGKQLHTAIRYGVSQALLDAVAQSRGVQMCDVVAEEYGTTVRDTPVPVFMQSGDSRYENADKMIMKHTDVLPHGLFNNLDKLGQDGSGLRAYIAWLRDRIIKLRTEPDYSPVMHLDVYGNIGTVFGHDNYDTMADYIQTLEETAKPFKLRIEGPMDAGNREQQMIDLRELTKRLDERNIAVELVADEWCNTLEDVKYFADNRAGHMIQIKTPDLGGIGNTIEAVLYCKNLGIGAYQGGTCNETDRSAQVCVQAAMATSPVQILAKPGMGVDEGFMIVYNEMQRVIAIRGAENAAH